jgi:hypothetical protein
VYAEALKVLLEYLRKQSITDYGNRLLVSRGEGKRPLAS